MRGLTTLRTGLLAGFSSVFGTHGRDVACPEFQAPRLVLRGHEGFCIATGWRLRRWDWEVIRLKCLAALIVVQKDPVQVAAGRMGPKDFMQIAVPGHDVPARYVAGLLEFRTAFGCNMDQRGWDEMWRRVGEKSMLIVMGPSQLNHGEQARV